MVDRPATTAVMLKTEICGVASSSSELAVAGASVSATCTTEADEEDRSATSSNRCQATRISSTTSTAVSIAQPFSVSIATEHIRQKVAKAEGTQQADTKQARGDAADNSAETKTWPQLMGPRMV